MTVWLEAVAVLLAVVLAVVVRARLHAGREARAAKARLRRFRQSLIELLRGDFTELEDMLLRLLRNARETLEVERVSLWLFDEARSAIERRALVCVDPAGPDGPVRLDGGRYPLYFAAVSQEFVIDACDASSDARTQEFASDYLPLLGIGAMLDVPLRRFGAHIGLVCFEHRGGPRRWSAEEQEFAGAIAAQITYAFEHDELRRAQQALLARTLHDGDTGLPNAVMLRDRIEATLAQGCGLVLLGLPRMRLVAASRGREFADAMTRAVVARWRATIGEGRLLARTGRDEFALLLPGSEQARTASAWARRLRADLAEPIEVAGESFRLEAAIAIADCSPGEPLSADELYAEASAALREAAPGSVRARDPQLRAQAHRRLDIEQSLRQAVATDAFEPWVQPVVDASTRRVVALEALVRWRDPVHGLRAPAEFLVEAIESGLIVPIGRRAMALSIAEFARIRRLWPQLDCRLAINLAAPELLAESLEPHLLDCLDAHQVPVERLVVEVTETALVKDLERAQRTLELLHAAGACICLDDFGTGFSSLTWLKRFPITEIKIEGSFVRGIGNDWRDEAIVQSVIDLAAKLGQQIVAEGVESREQHARLRAYGVRKLQGYLYSQPFPFRELDAERLRRCELAIPE